jgi:hypothetical protein
LPSLISSQQTFCVVRLTLFISAVVIDRSLFLLYVKKKFIFNAAFADGMTIYRNCS